MRVEGERASDALSNTVDVNGIFFNPAIPMGPEVSHLVGT